LAFFIAAVLPLIELGIKSFTLKHC